MLCFTLQWINKEICFLSCQRTPEHCYSGTVYCLAFTGKLKAPVIAQYLLFILLIALETAQFILKAASGASVANPWEYLCRALFTTLSHTSSGHILSVSSPFMSLQWPVLLAVLHNFLLSSHRRWSQPASTCAYLGSFIPDSVLCLHQASQHALGHTILWLIMLLVCQGFWLAWCDHSKEQNLGRSLQNERLQAVVKP